MTDTPPLRVVRFRAPSPRTPRLLSDLPPVAQKALRLAVVNPAAAEVIERIIDRLLKHPTLNT